MADKDNVFDIGIGTSVDNSGLKKDLNKAQSQIKNFASEASKSLTGVDFSKLLVPGAIVGASIATLTKLKGALDDMAAAYRVQEQAEAALKNAAKNNPYLNDRAVKQLKNFADEMQNLTGIGSDQILQSETRLASLGRNQQQIQTILKTAADMAAAGVMSFDEAVGELNNSLNGVVRTSGRLYPELKSLSKEALASGQAIEIIGQKVAGSAAEAMKTGAGSVTAYKNAVGDLKKLYGEDWENATRGFRAALTEIVSRIVEAKKAAKEVYEMMKDEETDINEMFENITEAQKKVLKEISANAHFAIQKEINELMLDGLDIMTATEEALRTIARVNGVNVEVTRRAVLENKEINEELRTNLELLGDKIMAEREAGIAAKAAFDAATAATKAYTEAALDAAFKAGKASREAAEAAAKGDEKAARIARLRAQEYAKIAEAEVKKWQDINENTQNGEEILKKMEKELALEIEKIERKAMLEGKSVESLEVQKQILDAQTTAYEKMLEATRDIIDNAPEIQDRLNQKLKTLKKEYAQQRELAKTDEERKKALQELAKMQDDIKTDVKRIKTLADETALQEEIAEIKKKSLTEAAEHEQKIRREWREKEKEDKLQELDDNFNLAVLSTQLTNEEKAKLEKEYLENREQLVKNFADQELIIEKETVKAIEQAHVEMYQRLLSLAQEYLNAASSIASSISTIWTNNIDYETNKKLIANDKLIQSDEERAAAEKKINIEAAYERYKAELFAWTTNVIMAQANAAMAILNALNSQPFLPMGPVMAGLATAMGAMQVAAVISARPKPPRFHSGGVVEGTGEKSAILKGGEVVQTQRQFQNTMQAINNLASGGGNVQMNVKIENNASDKVEAKAQMTADGLEVLIEGIVNKGFQDGTFDQGLAQQQSHQRGASLL